MWRTTVHDESLGRSSSHPFPWTVSVMGRKTATAPIDPMGSTAHGTELKEGRAGIAGRTTRQARDGAGGRRQVAFRSGTDPRRSFMRDRDEMHAGRRRVGSSASQIIPPALSPHCVPYIWRSIHREEGADAHTSLRRPWMLQAWSSLLGLAILGMSGQGTKSVAVEVTSCTQVTKPAIVSFPRTSTSSCYLRFGSLILVLRC